MANRGPRRHGHALAIWAGAALIAAPLLRPGAPAQAALDCSPGTVVEACAGVSQGEGWWQPAAFSVNGFNPGRVTVTGAAILDVPYYVTTHGDTEIVHPGPSGVTTWTLPANARATVYVLPTQPTMAGSAVVTVDVPQTGHQSGTYVVSWPALPPGTPELQPITMQWLGGTGQHHPRNTIPVKYAANEPIFGLSADGPWVRTLEVPPDTPAWIHLPVDQTGLTATAEPHFSRAKDNPAQYNNALIGTTRLVMREAALANPSQTPATTRPALTVEAPGQAKAGQAIAVRVTLTDHGTPLADQVVQLTTTAGRLATPTVTTDAQGQAEDTLTGAPPGTVTVSAQALGAQGAARIQVAAPPTLASAGQSRRGGAGGSQHSAAAFPWWLVLVLAVALGVLVLLLVRRRRHRDRAGEEPEASDP